MVFRSLEGGIIQGFEVGKEKVVLSHLQFTDDTIFFCSGKEDSFLILNHILKFFEALSGLKINRDKCHLLGLNCEEGKLRRWASLVGCKVGVFPSSYLGLPLGHNPKSLSVWNPVIEKVRKRLASWKRSFFSKGGG